MEVLRVSIFKQLLNFSEAMDEVDLYHFQSCKACDQISRETISVFTTDPRMTE